MTKATRIALALGALALPIAAQATLPVGARAPEFTTQGAMAGKPMAFDLRAALRKGPVVLYFYPKAFTHGCTLEAHAFADAHDDFVKAGATVIGMSADDLPAIQRFSTDTTACSGKFAVAMASPAVIKAYDVALSMVGMPTGVTNRTSYVIASDGTITFVHSDLDYRDHVKMTLAAVQALKPKG